MVEKITDESFEAFVSCNHLAVVDCYADWCLPCRMISPVIDALSEEYNGKIVFGKLDVDKNRETPAKYDIMSIPAILIFKNKKLVEKIAGALAKNVLKEKIEKHL